MKSETKYEDGGIKAGKRLLTLALYTDQRWAEERVPEETAHEEFARLLAEGSGGADLRPGVQRVRRHRFFVFVLFC